MSTRREGDAGADEPSLGGRGRLQEDDDTGGHRGDTLRDTLRDTTRRLQQYMGEGDAGADDLSGSRRLQGGHRTHAKEVHCRRRHETLQGTVLQDMEERKKQCQ